ncbi:831_t:CDS:2 [Paraglomus occultum]|uniref:831_t:CDS:1 n=1 Tax=Paraglomus occultum TaxID=144539 RepID=A0A9N9FRH0_9GLOM|nr:831_t:CDS:2 [Paraglomus occultum]
MPDSRKILAEKWINEQRHIALNGQYDNCPDENKKTSAPNKVFAAEQSRKRTSTRATLKKSLRKPDSENTGTRLRLQAPGSSIMNKFRSPVVTSERITLKRNADKGMFGLFKASNAVKISKKVANHIAKRKAESSNGDVETGSSDESDHIYVVKAIKKKARKTVDTNENGQHAKAHNKDRDDDSFEIQNVNGESAGVNAHSNSNVPSPLCSPSNSTIGDSCADMDLHMQWKNFKSRSADKGKVTNKSVLFSRFFDRVNQKREKTCCDDTKNNKSNGKNKNEYVIDNEQQGKCGEMHEQEGVNKAVQEEVLSIPKQTKTIEDTRNYANTAANEFEKLPDEAFNSNDVGYNGYNSAQDFQSRYFSWTNAGEFNTGGLDENEIKNSRACRQPQSKSRLFDWWKEDQKKSPVIGSSSLMLPDYSNQVHSNNDNRSSTVPQYTASQENLRQPTSLFSDFQLYNDSSYPNYGGFFDQFRDSSNSYKWL